MKYKFIKKGLRGTWVVLMSLVLVCMTTAAICIIAAGIYIQNYVKPDIEVDLDSFRLNFTSYILYEDPETGEEQILEQLYNKENRVWASIDEIPLQLQKAFIAVEDARFPYHNGVDWIRTIGATLNYVVQFRDNFGGGSTITQQLIKNLTGENETSVKRKMQEVMRALELEKTYSKEEILEMYLNTIYFGQGAYGVKTAAYVYFNKELSELTLAECASIAGMTKNPYKYDLYRFPHYNAERRATVLGQMVKEEYITEEEKNAALAEEVKATRGYGGESSGYQSYFADALIEQVIKDLMEKKGYSETTAKLLLYGGGLRISSTIDVNIQDTMDAVFQDTENFPGTIGADGNYPEASMVLMNPYNGKVLALYGGRGDKEGDLILNRATKTTRPAGSVIKPLSVYAPGFEYGYILPTTVVDDAPKDFTIRETGWPKNENQRYSGRCTILNGMAQSYTTVAVDVLQQLGVRTAFDFLRDHFGVTTLVESRVKTYKDGSTAVLSDLGLSPLALGGLTDGMTVLELTAAYSAFVNDGKYIEPLMYTRVTDSYGNILLDNSTPVVTIAMEERTRDYMIQMLTNVVTAGTGRSAALSGIEVGGKTGTTSDDKDRWFAGVTPYYTGVCWFGYDTPQTLTGYSSNPALYLWRQVMSQIHEDLESVSFEYCTEMVKVSYCQDSGLLPCDACYKDERGSRVKTAWLAPEDVPTETCNCHVFVPICRDSNKIATQYCTNLYNSVRLNFQRYYPAEGLVITDQQYCLPYDPLRVLDPLDPEAVEYAPVYSGAYTLVECPLHTAPFDPTTWDPLGGTTVPGWIQ